LGDMDAPGMVGRDYPDTSHSAAVTPKFNTQRYKVLEALRDRHRATAAMIAVDVGLSRNQTATRLLELRQGGYAMYVLDDQGNPIRNPTGPSTEGRVHELTHAGRNVLL
jgi:hypothetical protein